MMCDPGNEHVDTRWRMLSVEDTDGAPAGVQEDMDLETDGEHEREGDEFDIFILFTEKFFSLWISPYGIDADLRENSR